MTKKQEARNLESVVERHYWRGVAFLVILILVGTGFWCLRHYNPALFLGKPDFIAAPTEELPNNISTESVKEKPGLLNINTATVEELQTLPSIGPQTAKKIIQFREEQGGFSSVETLTEVKGIGEKTLEKVIPYITAE